MNGKGDKLRPCNIGVYRENYAAIDWGHEPAQQVGSHPGAAHVVWLLKIGHELVNRGHGWWIAPPRKPYGAHAPVQVDEQLVDQLEAEGKIKIEIPYTSAIATLK